MPMLVKTKRPPLKCATIIHPLAQQIDNLPPVADIDSPWQIFHGALGAEGYRLGVKYLDAGIRVSRGALIARSNNNSKDPIHVLFPQFRPAKHPTDEKYPTPPISPDDVAACLAGMQAQQRKFKLFEHEDKNWERLGWPSKIDPFEFSWHSSNAYITPLDSNCYFVSIDDVNTPEKKQILADMGIRPALIIVSSIDPETGEKNEQWTLKIPKLPRYRQNQNLIEHFAQHLPKPVDDEAIRSLAQRLNAAAGDPEVKSCTRDFRLPGFYQLKKKYVERGIFHIVSIKHAETCTCSVTEAMYHKIHAEIEKTTSRRVRPVSKKKDQRMLPTDAPAGQAPSRPAGASAPAPSKAAVQDLYPENPVYMAHAAEVQILEPDNTKRAPGRHQSKYRVLQRLIVTGSLEGIDQTTPLFKDAESYLKDRERANLYIYLRTEKAIDLYRDELQTQPASFQAHYDNAMAYFQDHDKSAQAAARRMFYTRHTRSVIERTMIESGIPPENAFAWAREGCSPSNRQIRADARYFEVWARIEKSAATKATLSASRPVSGKRTTGFTLGTKHRAAQAPVNRGNPGPLEGRGS